MESDQLSQDELFSSVYDYITISTAPSNDEKSFDEFESKLKLLTCDIIQNKVVSGLTLLQHAAKEGLSDHAKLITDSQSAGEWRGVHTHTHTHIIAQSA